MAVNITTGNIDIPFETYVDGTRVVVDQPNTMYSFDGNIVNFVKDFTTSDVRKFSIDAFGTQATIHDDHRYNCATVAVQDGAVNIQYTDNPTTVPEPITLNSDGISIDSTVYEPGNYYVSNVNPGSTITLSQTKYDVPLWIVANDANADNPDVYIGNDVQVTL